MHKNPNEPHARPSGLSPAGPGSRYSFELTTDGMIYTGAITMPSDPQVGDSVSVPLFGRQKMAIVADVSPDRHLSLEPKPAEAHPASIAALVMLARQPHVAADKFGGACFA